ncbi:WhiB family transcriptional regulator [Streptomyces sp. G1]|uniref:WhiB family transcriptional regulator n=1 Tax=Streptomyces sp. G1 TaxID=361572 RepID=UPI00202EE542|nr:WhiB family transcriptional regulator [Streptomyces sp. G1]MCM1964904.1 WhiB family transcriptional regulator [Streptomyces sp. G1]
MTGPRYAEPAAFGRDWLQRAECGPLNADLFYPEHSGTGPAYAPEAKELCAVCRVWLVCLSQALTRREPYGIWGGLDPDERQLRLRSLAEAEAAADAEPAADGVAEDAAAQAPVPA